MKLARVATMSFSIVSQLRKQLEAIKNQNIDITIISGRDDGMEFIDNLDIPHKDIQIPRDISLIKDFFALVNHYLYFRHAEERDKYIYEKNLPELQRLADKIKEQQEKF